MANTWKDLAEAVDDLVPAFQTLARTAEAARDTAPAAPPVTKAAAWQAYNDRDTAAWQQQQAQEEAARRQAETRPSGPAVPAFDPGTPARTAAPYSPTEAEAMKDAARRNEAELRQVKELTRARLEANKEVEKDAERRRKEREKEEKEAIRAQKEAEKEAIKEAKEFEQRVAKHEKDYLARPTLAGQAYAGVAGAAGRAGKGLSSGVGAAAALAGGGAAGVIGGLAGQLKQFVEALNPAAVAQFGVVMRDLSAVIGTAVEPVFQVLSQAAREVADLLLPVAQELAPVFGQIAQTVLRLLQPGLQVFASIVSGLTPVLQIFADVLSGIAPLFQTFSTLWAALIRTLADAFKGLFGEQYRDGMKVFQSALQRLATAAIVAAGALAKLLGQDKFLSNLIEAAGGGRKASSTGLAAATNARLTTLPELGRSLSVSAFTANQGAGPKKTEDWLKDAVEQLKDIQSGNLSANKILGDIKEALIREAGILLRQLQSVLSVRLFEAIKEAYGPKTQAAVKAASGAAGQGGLGGGAFAGAKALYDKFFGDEG